ncbi:ClpP/crotonase-like domain-containing protein [Chytriomyces cf. hyalinus JEL632]|nr:ClpP/crotonase-like domain-containing protein [Chytriomyces cf. hyalinus JEL632]
MTPFPNYETLRVSMPFPHVAHVELNRPKKLNAFNTAMWTEIGACFRAISDDTSIRSVVLSGGSAKGFTAGLDLSDFAPVQGEDAARAGLVFMQLVRGLQESLTAIEKCRQPVIAAVHGPCIGAGIDAITACDVRVCASDTVFSVREVDVGLAADVGTLQRLPKVVGNQSWVHDVCLTARNFGAKEAFDFQLVSEVVEGGCAGVLECAFKKAVLIAEKSPVAVVGTKNVLKYSRDHSVEDGLNYVGVWNASAIQTEDMMRAAGAAMSKTKATFSKL